MSDKINNIVIVGGGSAGWLTAGVLAAEYNTQGDDAINITLVESDIVAPVGVGEGTWPSMRATLEKMGISETEFLLECDASFKQGSQFNNWLNGNDHYFHPFTLPIGNQELDIAPYWQVYKDKISFANAVCPQGHLSERHLAPKQISTAEYSYAANYGYHLDAAKLGAFLQKHCTQKLGVKQVIDHVTHITSAENGDIASIATAKHGELIGDLFIDCTGSQSLLLGQHFKVPFVDCKHTLFNDSALAAHVPYASENSPINSFTHSTAQTAGWIWDIGLPSRRGVGHTYSSEHISDDSAEQQLRQYIAQTASQQVSESVAVRKISFQPGYRSKFWQNNCVAIGLSAGFIEPLEASALALVELSAKMLSEQLPGTQQDMEIVAKRFNQKFSQRWQNIIDFLKLHYVLSKRTDSAYWQDNRDNQTIPESLQQLLTLWQYQPPSHYDIPQTEALFPTASFQYILYGMGFESGDVLGRKRKNKAAQAERLFAENMQHSKHLLAALPGNRELLNKIKKYGLPKI
ncbi:tryptophan 7-halogenase [Alteromonas pelagimontana]|uniref:Tryptophan 7-halogenase n=1 Tax=Alteromonas pelagimontana TaxID=1858656 RepID=A0A6M4MDF6_9ALTE|nr:tryptophan halogenase family protein [Alteromonas pelagimontana]QJR80660.1 tryptophan 7-halogenase [Alteromonas pelagimontana]